MFEVICNMLEYNHSKVPLFRKNPLSSVFIFHLQTISFALTMGTFCVPCSGGLHLKYFLLLLLHCSPNELLGVSVFLDISGIPCGIPVLLQGYSLKIPFCWVYFLYCVGYSLCSDKWCLSCDYRFTVVKIFQWLFLLCEKICHALESLVFWGHYPAWLVLGPTLTTLVIGKSNGACIFTAPSIAPLLIM